MRRLFVFFALFSQVLFSCDNSPISKKNREKVAKIVHHVQFIDDNNRVKILEDDFHHGDSIYKIRAFYTEEELVKLVAIFRTHHFERDDYFYFQHHKPIFTGHIINEQGEHLAAEYKYYFEEDNIIESLYWEDHYQPGKRLPHEKFKVFNVDLDSVYSAEIEKIMYYMQKLSEQNIEIKHLNENLEANTLDE